MGEIVGSEYPDEVVVLGGHIDSWDVGQGAMDDAGGVVAAWEAVRMMNDLGLRPRRTVRIVGWTSEENGGPGGRAYAEAHADEYHVLAMESDAGVFEPQGFGFTGSEEAFGMITEIGTLLTRIHSGAISRGGGGADITPSWKQACLVWVCRSMEHVISGTTTLMRTRLTSLTLTKWHVAQRRWL